MDTVVNPFGCCAYAGLRRPDPRAFRPQGPSRLLPVGEGGGFAREMTAARMSGRQVGRCMAGHGSPSR